MSTRLRDRAGIMAPVVALAAGLAWPPQRAPAEGGAATRGAPFEERQVAGGPDDFMTVRHVKLRGSQRDIGRKLGDLARDYHRVRPAPAEADGLARRREFYQRNYPIHLERAAGAAEAFGVRTDDAVETLLLTFNLDLSAGCSIVFYPPGYTDSGHAVLSRNYDFTTGTYAQLMGAPSPPGARPMTADVYVMEIYPDTGYASLSVCAYELLSGCLDGVNSAGLTVGLAANYDPEDEPRPAGDWRPGLSEIEIGRFLLDTCRNVDEATTRLANLVPYYRWVPCHYLIGDRSGRSVVWAYSADGQRQYTTPGRGQPQILTNHPLYREQLATPADDGSSDSRARYARLQQNVTAVPQKRSLADVKRANASVAWLGNDVPPERTLWHALYDCDERSLEVDFYLGEGPGVDAGRPKRSGYLKFKLDVEQR